MPVLTVDSLFFMKATFRAAGMLVLLAWEYCGDLITSLITRASSRALALALELALELALASAERLSPLSQTLLLPSPNV